MDVKIPEIYANLRPCPFCHRKPALEQWSIGSMYRVKCKNPNCPCVGICVISSEEIEKSWNQMVENVYKKQIDQKNH